MATDVYYIHDESTGRKMDPTISGYDTAAYNSSGNPQYNQQIPEPQGNYPISIQNSQGYVHPNNIIIMTQPEAAIKKDYDECLAFSIFHLIFCCCPLGLVAVGFSCEARAATRRLDFEKGKSVAKTVEILNFVGVLIGSLTFLSVVLVYAIRNRFGYY